jgi:predicted RNA-binding protein with PUA-like domain
MELGAQKTGGRVMAYWLVKSEPDAFSFGELKALGAKGSEWTGVRNYQARNNMRAMKIGEKILYYHSNIGLEVVGIAEVIALVHPDSTTDDVRWECVDIRAVVDMPKPVSRDACKANPILKDMVLVVNTRLSVQPVSEAEWVEVCRMGGLVPAPK